MATREALPQPPSEILFEESRSLLGLLLLLLLLLLLAVLPSGFDNTAEERSVRGRKKLLALVNKLADDEETEDTDALPAHH